jgi:hypothetical protein
MLHACLCTICFVFCYTSWHFYAFSRTNLLTRCHSASSLFSVVFVFQKSYTGNILGIGRNKSRSSYFSLYETESKAETEGGQRTATPPMTRATPGHARDRCGPLVHLLTSPFGLYIILDDKTLRRPINFPKNILQAAVVVDARSGGSRSSSRHPAREGNPHQRPSSSPCLPLE